MEVGGSYSLEGASFEGLVLWRPRIGEAVTIVDASGGLFRGRVEELGKRGARVFVFEGDGVLRGLPVEVVLLQALPEKERMELIIQKATELGAAKIVPFKSERSISLEERESGQRKAHKWQDLALKASKQSRRETIAEVLSYASFEEALTFSKNSDLKLALWERKGIPCLKESLAMAREKGIGKVALLSGPEGGFTAAEMEEAERKGFGPVSLGRRILRAETASIVAVGIVMYELEGR